MLDMSNINEHVRVDIFYRDATSKYKTKVNLILGILFLMPMVFVIGYFSIDLVEMSWKIKEISTEAGGLNYVYIQKTLILLFPLSLLLTIIYQLREKLWK